MLNIQDGVIQSFEIRLLKSPEEEIVRQNAALRRLLTRIKEFNADRAETPEDRRATFKLVHGEKK
jgi:hypothetical protein